MGIQGNYSCGFLALSTGAAPRTTQASPVHRPPGLPFIFLSLPSLAHSSIHSSHTFTYCHYLDRSVTLYYITATATRRRSLAPLQRHDLRHAPHLHNFPLRQLIPPFAKPQQGQTTPSARLKSPIFYITMKRFITAGAVIAAAISGATADLCSQGSTEDNGNWYCQEVTGITYTGVGGTGSYNKVTKMDSSSGTCSSSAFSYSGSLSPLDEEVSHNR